MTVVIPAMNEAENLYFVIPLLPPEVTEVILVDGSSTDDTIEVARRLRPDVKVVPQQGRGKGNALQTGFLAATGDIIVMLDADGSADPGEIPRFVDALVRGAHFAKGTRFTNGAGSQDITRLRGAGNAVLTQMVNVLFRTRYTDLCYGYNAFWSACVPVLDVDCNGFEVETLINIRASMAGLRVEEVPSYEHARIAGVSNLNAARDGLRVLRTILWERTRSRRDRSRSIALPGRLVQLENAEEDVAAPPAVLPALPSRMRSAPSGTAPTASVVVCVYTEDRWDHIEEALDSLERQTLPPTEVIVVVDHNEVLKQRLVEAYPKLQVVENRFDRGLSGARNTGVCLAAGDVIAFLDDDARADGSWLEAMLRPYRDPSVAGVGGLILPDWGHDDPPAWLPDEFLWTVGCSYRGLPSTTSDVRNPIGASMSFRRAAFERAGFFDGTVGRNDAVRAPMGGEETEFSIRLRTAWPGTRIVHEPSSVAHHHVASSRATWRYFRRRCYAEGLSKRQVSAASRSAGALHVERGYVKDTLVRALAKDAAGLLRRPDRMALQRLAGIGIGVTWAAAGYVRGALQRPGGSVR